MPSHLSSVKIYQWLKIIEPPAFLPAFGSMSSQEKLSIHLLFEMVDVTSCRLAFGYLLPQRLFNPEESQLGALR